MKVHNIIITLIIIVFTSCRSTDIANSPSTVANLGLGDEKPLLLSSVFEFEGWIKLEASKESMLTNVSKIEVTNDAIYVLDRGAHTKLCKFNKEGHYICNIGNRGSGRGEFTDCNDFSIDQKTGNILILNNRSQIIVYDKMGKFLYAKTLDVFRSTHIKATKNGIFTYNDCLVFDTKEDNYHICGFDGDLKKTNNWLMTDEPGGLPIIYSVFQNAGEKLYYIDDVNNCIYMYDNKTKEFVKSLELSLPNPCPVEVRVNTNKFGKVVGKVDHILSIVVGEKTAVVYFNSPNSQAIKISTIELKSGRILQEGVAMSLPEYISTVDKNIVYAVYSPENFCRNNGLLPLYPQEHQIGAEINSESNFVIAKLRMKSFDKK